MRVIHVSVRVGFSSRRFEDHSLPQTSHLHPPSITTPPPTAVETKLYGTLEELRRTAAFIENTGLFI
nr:hypothetical protein BaRGS_025565 [Batillaria attramentaria]